MAIAQLILVLPVVVGRLPHAERSRFMPLDSLHRAAPVKPDGVDDGPLSDAEWQAVRTEIDQLLLSGYRRRLQLISQAELEFRRMYYDWLVLDPGLRMYKAHRKQGADPRMPQPLAVLSHCYIHDITYIPALKAYRDYIQGRHDAAVFNHKLCLYHGEKKLSSAEKRYIYRELGTESFYPIHSDQLRISLETNFARTE